MSISRQPHSDTLGTSRVARAQLDSDKPDCVAPGRLPGTDALHLERISSIPGRSGVISDTDLDLIRS